MATLVQAFTGAVWLGFDINCIFFTCGPLAEHALSDLDMLQIMQQSALMDEYHELEVAYAFADGKWTAAERAKMRMYEYS